MSAATTVSVESLFASPASLPTVPKVVQQLIQSFSRDDVSINEIARQLAADPVLSAKTLRLANSAYFRASRQVGTIDEALHMLGFVIVRNLVVGCGVVGAFKNINGLDLSQFWRFSLLTAVTARWLGQQLGENSDQCFTVGLLHPLGELVMHAAMPEEMRKLNRETHPLALERSMTELDQFGFHYGHVSAELAKRWQFPPEMLEPLKWVPDPMQAGSGLVQLVSIMHLAAWRARVDILKWPIDKIEACCPVGKDRTIELPVLLDHTGHLVEQRGGKAVPPLATLTQGLEAMLG